VSDSSETDLDEVKPMALPPSSVPVQPVRTSFRYADTLFAGLVWFAAFITLASLVGIILSLLVGAWPSIHTYGWSLISDTNWDPTNDQFGGFTMIFGTLMTSLIALIIAVPVSFGIALFLTELSPQWLRRPLATAIELLAAIPSIVYGMWGLLVFSPLLSEYVQIPLQNLLADVPGIGVLVQGPPVGIGIFAAGIILAIMIIPFIASVMRDVFSVAPVMLKESAYGMGCTTWEVVRHIVLPYTKAGVIGGIMLGLGRAMGETMAVTFIVGNSSTFSGASLFDAANTITSALANDPPVGAVQSGSGTVLYHLCGSEPVESLITHSESS
jgi:phosphate transport system permease protein